MTVLAMSHGELSRYDTLQRVERGELWVDDAARLLGLKRPQVFRLLDRMRRTEGAAGVLRASAASPVTGDIARPFENGFEYCFSSTTRICGLPWQLNTSPSDMIASSRTKLCANG